MGHVYDFVANSTDGVMAVDAAQRIVLWNAAAAEILGYTSSETLGKRCYTILRSRDCEGCPVCRRNCDVIEGSRRLTPPRWMEVEAVDSEGRDQWLSLSTLVVPSRGGRLNAIVHVFRRVTLRHESLRVLEEFAAIVGRLAADHVSCQEMEPHESTSCVELTRREREILMHLAGGEATEAIADALCISSRTVRNHISNLLLKLGVHSRLEAVTYSIRNGLVKQEHEPAGRSGELQESAASRLSR